MMDKKHDGKLFVVESPELPFDIARCFWITNVPPRGVRGSHAHIKCKQFYICMKGCVGVRWNNGVEEGEFFLQKGHAFLVDSLVWTEETFMTGDDLLLVLCSEKYSIDDYINTIEELKKYINEANN